MNGLCTDRRVTRGLVALIVSTAVIAPPGSVVAQSPTPATYQSLPYRYIGPPGNKVLAVAGVPGDANILYAGSASGGIFKSVDAGVHWQPIFDDQSVASIGALAVARSDANVVWAGTGEAEIRSTISIGDGMYKSTDAGKTWSHMGLHATGRIARVVIHPADPNIVYAAALGHAYGPQAERGVFRTTNGGRTWDRVLFVDENTGGVDIVMDPSNPKTLFAAMWQLTIYPWYSEAGGPSSGMYMSRDGGTTWTHLTGHGLPSAPLGRIALAIAPSNPKRIYALIETVDQGNLWRSDDGGENWALVSRNPAINLRARYFSHVGVLPDNPDEVYFLAARLFLSLDGGPMVRTVEEVYPDQHDIWFDPLNPNRIVVANDRYVNISTTRGRSWFRAQLPIATMYHVTTDRRIPYNVFGNRQDGPGVRGPSNSLINTGQILSDMWELVGMTETGWSIPDPEDDNIVWASDASHIEQFDLRTRNTRVVSPWPPRGGGGGAGGAGRGGLLADRPFRMNWSFPMAMSPHANPRRVYAGSQFVHQTTDRGRTWTIISPDLTMNDKSKQGVFGGLWPDAQDVPSSLFSIAESPLEPGVIWAGSNDGLVHVTRDGGKNWSNVTAGMPGLGPWGTVTSIDPSPHAKGTAYVTVDRHRANDPKPYLFKTENYGQTWKAIAAGIPRSVFSYTRVVREDIKRKGLLYLGTENALYASFDDGATWLPLQNNLPHAPVSWMVVQPDFDDLVVSTYGRGFWILDDVTPLQQLTTAVLSERSHLFDPRPAYLLRTTPVVANRLADEWDPATGTGRNPPYGASINYYLGTTVSTEPLIVVQDDKGATIRTLFGARAAGINRVWWDLRGDSSTAPSAAASGGRAGGGRAGGGGGGRGSVPPLVAAGTYTIRLTVDGKESVAKLTVRNDPNALEP
jgi:photosystem II stability/assembly factor-like uncharacterized protein